MKFQSNKILVVDDAKINRSMLENIINQHLECQIILAGSAEETFNKLKEDIPDIILLDVLLPDLDGFEIAKKIKSNPVTKDVPIIFITSLTDESSKLKAFEVGGIDYLTKPFSSKEVVSRIAAQLKLKSQYEEIKRMNQHIMYEISMARRIQNVIMPRREYNFNNLSIQCKYIPFEYIGGDFFDIFEGTENIYYILIIDVTGHGIPAALYTMMLKSHFYYLTKRFTSTSDILNQLNSDISKLLLDDFYPTALLIKIDLNLMTMEYANAGHPGPIVIRNNELMELENKNFSLAMDPHVKITEDVIKIKNDDKIFLFTDGIFEIQNKNNNFLSKDFVYNLLKNGNSFHLKDQLDNVILKVKEESNKGFFEDDVTMIGIHVL